MSFLISFDHLNPVVDAHLHTLQQLAAHVKLLIDAPENLWRLIERKKYFSATWLFLLVRVVHRALVRDDEQDSAWRGQGIDVPVSQFSLITRKVLRYRLSVRIPSYTASMGCCFSISHTNYSQGDTGLA
jgi:hypothetical protein